MRMIFKNGSFIREQESEKSVTEEVVINSVPSMKLPEFVMNYGPIISFYDEAYATRQMMHHAPITISSDDIKNSGEPFGATELEEAVGVGVEINVGDEEVFLPEFHEIKDVPSIKKPKAVIKEQFQTNAPGVWINHLPKWSSDQDQQMI